MTARSRSSLGSYVALLMLMHSVAVGKAIEFETSEVTQTEITVSPDGETLVFTVVGRLFRVSAKGGDAQQLTVGPYCDNVPSFSPDGHRLAFISDRSGTGFNLFLLDLGSRRITRLTSDGNLNQSIAPVWSGENIYFVNNPKEIVRYVNLGYRSIEHPSGDVLYDDFLFMLAQTGTFWCPTLAGFRERDLTVTGGGQLTRFLERMAVELCFLPAAIEMNLAHHSIGSSSHLAKLACHRWT